MKIKKFKGKDGCAWICGAGTPDEVDKLNIEKDFDAALDTLQTIRITHNYLFNRTESPVMDRSVYGKRENTGR